jgi:hypothetical protein
LEPMLHTLVISLGTHVTIVSGCKEKQKEAGEKENHGRNYLGNSSVRLLLYYECDAV